MPLRAMRLSRVHSAKAFRVGCPTLRINARLNRLQMGRIHTKRIATEMVYNKTIRDGTIDALIGKTMSATMNAVADKDSVSSSIGPRPYDAIPRVACP